MARLAAARRRRQSRARCRSCTASRGERRLTEWEVPWLPGYEDSQPVRIGNAAHNQFQLDVYRRGDGRAASGAPGRAWRQRGRLGTCSRAFSSTWRRIWREPDEGIWEVRGAAPALHPFQGDGLGRLRPRHQERGGVRPRRPGRALARAARRRSTPRSAHAASMPSWAASCSPTARNELDASLLLMPLVGFLPPDDPRVRGTVEAIERELLVDGFVLRYDTAKSRRRPAAGRGRVPRLQLLAGRRLCDARPARRRASAVRAPAGAAQRRRPAEPRNTTRARAAWSATSRRPSRTSALVNTASQSRASPQARRAAFREARRGQACCDGAGEIALLTAASLAGRVRALAGQRRSIQGGIP